MLVTCLHCNSAGDAGLPDDRGFIGLLSCPQCSEPIARVNISDAKDWIEARVQAKAEMQRTGRMGTRKQSFGQSDIDIDRDGIAAELVAAIILCPGRVGLWCEAAERGGNNRGRDLPASMTVLDRPVEVKQTRYMDANRGYLIVRPPRMTPGDMRAEYLDNSLYVFMHGQPYEYSLLGWIDCGGLVAHGRLNPVPVRPGQRECWGIHWSKLRPLNELAERFVRPTAPVESAV